MANIYNEPGSTNVKITLKNNVYSYLNTNIGIAKICLITDQKKFGYSDLLGNLKKCLTDASGSSVTPKNCVFIADSEGSASHSTTFVYNDNKLGVNIAAPQNKAHFHEPSTGNCLIQITNTSRGSSDGSDGMTLGIIDSDNVIRTTYGHPVKIQVEDNSNPGTFTNLATFQNLGSSSINTILDTDLTVSIIPAKTTAASVFLTHENNTIKTRTAAQVREDIGAQPAITGAATTITADNLTVGRALISDGSGKVAVSSVKSTELGYLSGVTSAIQTQINGKQPTITGTANRVLKVQSDGTGIGESIITDDGSTLKITTSNLNVLQLYRKNTGTTAAGLTFNTRNADNVEKQAMKIMGGLSSGVVGSEKGYCYIDVINGAAYDRMLSIDNTGVSVAGNALVNGKTSTNKLNTGTFVRKTLKTNYTIIDLNDETSWCFRINTTLTNNPAVYFSNAKEGDIIFVMNQRGSHPVEILLNYTSGSYPNLNPGGGMLLICVGKDADGGYPAFAVAPYFTMPRPDLEP